MNFPEGLKIQSPLVRKAPGEWRETDLRSEFDGWRVESYEGHRGYMAYWNCSCRCGHKFVASSWSIRRKKLRCRGCWRGFPAGGNAQVGKTAPEYAIWRGIISRCTNPNVKAYSRYGGLGITVCERWSVFLNFLEDMGRRPSPKHSIDRIDNSKGYEPGNCRWATDLEQANNQRTNRLLTVKGVTKTLAEWARAVGMQYGTLQTRLDLGWSHEAAVLTPITNPKYKQIDASAI